MKPNILNEHTIRNTPYSKVTYSKVSPFHKHSFFEFAICCEGELTNHINGMLCEMKSGSVILLRPEDAHFFQCKSSHRSRDIYVPVNIMKKLCDTVSPAFFREVSSTPTLIRFDLPQRTLAEIEMDLSTLSNYKDFPEKLIKSLYFNVIYRLFFLWQQKAANEKSFELNFAPQWLISIIQSSYSEKFLLSSIDEIVKSTYLSHGYFCREFKKYMGQTFSEFLRESKFSYAKTLLQENELTISEISEKLNYTEDSNFVHAFKKRFNISPARWRKLNFYN